MHPLPESKFPPALQAKARRIAIIGRIVVTELVPEAWTPEVEYRLFLCALGVLMENHPTPFTAPNVF